MKTCYDPEIPVNIVDLGLIYSMEMKKGEAGGRRVEVKMTLTAQGCGMGPSIAADARQKILSLGGIQEAQVTWCGIRPGGRKWSRRTVVRSWAWTDSSEEFGKSDQDFSFKFRFRFFDRGEGRRAVIMKNTKMCHMT